MTYGLRGTVSAGMFPTEAIVVFNDSDGREIGFIAPRNHIVHEREGRAAVRVRVLESKDGLVLIELPGEVYGEREVTVTAEQLEQV